MTRLHTVLLAFAASSALAGTAQAATILVDSGERIGTISFSDPLGQSFVAQGTQLQTIGLQFATPNPSAPQNTLTIALREGAGLTGNILRSLTITPVNAGRDDPKLFSNFDFSGVTLTNGAAYTITFLNNNGEGARNGIVFGPDLINPPFGTEFEPDAYVPGRVFSTGISAAAAPIPRNAT
jgi:hypothetical protein